MAHVLYVLSPAPIDGWSVWLAFPSSHTGMVPPSQSNTGRESRLAGARRLRIQRRGECSTCHLPFALYTCFHNGAISPLSYLSTQADPPARSHQIPLPKILSSSRKLGEDESHLGPYPQLTGTPGVLRSAGAKGSLYSLAVHLLPLRCVPLLPHTENYSRSPMTGRGFSYRMKILDDLSQPYTYSLSHRPVLWRESGRHVRAGVDQRK